MKTILSSRRHHYAARVTISLILVALIGGMVACGGSGGGESYTLTIDGTAGGVVAVNNVIIVGKAKFICDPGTVVRLNATPSADYRFGRWIGNVSTVVNTTAAVTTVTMNSHHNITACFEADFMVAASECHTLGLKSDGTAVAVGWNDTQVLGENQTGWLDVGNWTDINQVSADVIYTVGLKSDGTAVVTELIPSTIGFDSFRYNVGNWTGITRISTGFFYMVGLKSDGTVAVAYIPDVALPDFGQLDVGNWTNVVQVSAGLGHTVGLESNGTVIAVGVNETELGVNFTPCDVGNWTDIIQVSAGWLHTVGLKSDGTVVAVGWNDSGQCNVGNWTNIVQVAAGGSHTVGLKSDGTIVAVGWNYFGQCNVGNWTNIVQVATAGGDGAALGVPSWMHGGYTLGLRSDGTLVAAGLNNYGQCNVTGWDLN